MTSILFLGKANDERTSRAAEFCRLNFDDVAVFMGEWGDPLPNALKHRLWCGDYIVSYLSRWVLPEYVLNFADIAAVNFHPAPPEYPGAGCNNFALYEGAKEYGVTCHHMAAKVDTGQIIKVNRFPVFNTDDVATLMSRAYDYQLALFYDIMSLLAQDKPLPISPEGWTRQPFTKKQLNKLAMITPEMSGEEITRRVRATTFNGWRPVVTLGGFEFELKA